MNSDQYRRSWARYAAYARHTTQCPARHPVNGFRCALADGHATSHRTWRDSTGARLRWSR